MEDGVAVRCPCYEKGKIDSVLRQIPSKFRNCTFDNYHPKNPRQEMAKKIMTTEDNFSSSFFLVGPYGSGKTHLLYAQYRNVVEGGWYKGEALVRSTKDLISELTKSELDGEPSVVMESLMESEGFQLFWDDADKFKVTDYKMEILYDLVDKIYSRQEGLTMTSNLPLYSSDGKDLQEKLGPAIIRRIHDMCQVIEL